MKNTVQNKIVAALKTKQDECLHNAKKHALESVAKIPACEDAAAISREWKSKSSLYESAAAIAAQVK